MNNSTDISLHFFVTTKYADLINKAPSELDKYKLLVECMKEIHKPLGIKAYNWLIDSKHNFEYYNIFKSFVWGYIKGDNLFKISNQNEIKRLDWFQEHYIDKIKVFFKETLVDIAITFKENKVNILNEVSLKFMMMSIPRTTKLLNIFTKNADMSKQTRFSIEQPIIAYVAVSDAGFVATDNLNLGRATLGNIYPHIESTPGLNSNFHYRGIIFDARSIDKIEVRK
ncbi:MAG: hypothetical protein COB02_02525 [Candidatus Cloacimonadota bacterium]|nr:MAG: hypothetical protein COB02_02525 [Candidatus Cloacimonadota bacterium]